MKYFILVLSLILPHIAVAQDIKITFDLNHPTGVAEGRGSGFLHSLTGTEPPDRFVDPLKIKFWRGACFLDAALYGRLQRSDAVIQYVLSDGFQLSTQGTCWDQEETHRWPHTDPVLWQQHAEREAHKIKANGWNVVWEPWNEPDYWPGTVSDKEKFQQFMEAFLVAYRAVKKIDPSAKFAGPSLSAESWPAARQRLEVFLQFCADHNIELTNLTWHGFDDIKNTDRWPERIREMRGLAAIKYPSVKVQRVVISEIVAKDYFSSPGDLITSLKYLDDAGADFAARACHTKESCWLPNLDGALETTRDGAVHPNPRWWTNLWYASTIGPRYSGLSSHKGIAAYAVRAKGDLVVLLGFSKALGPRGSRTVILDFNKQTDSSLGMIRVERVPELKRGFLDEPIAIKNYALNSENGRTALKLPRVRPGDVYRIVVR